ncbi:hypothetical protein [Desulforegula conservatrix]|uniref:hypothetical protein n=1 Tax=Desulforegula conservatrix TaxID=153026 RepID=UPI000401FA35|nr:hypothetical protein [Desulforegula conservatrix]
MKKISEMSFFKKLVVGLNIAVFMLGSSICNAELKALTKNEMKSETAQAGLASFSMDNTNNSIRMFTDIHLETWTEIDSMKIGYYERGGVPGWDQDWSKPSGTGPGVQIGTAVSPMQMDGFVFKADFQDLGVEKPSLKRLVIGTNRLNGSITANLNSFTGIYNSALTDASDPNADKALVRQNLGEKTFNFDSGATEVQAENKGFFIVITPEGEHPGIQIVAGYNEINIPNNGIGGGEWWNKQ